jgi:Family of unknown function (DUF6526)
MLTMPEQQNLKNHVRTHPLFHFFLLPVLAINFIVAIVQAVRDPGLASVWNVVLAAALIVLALLVRTYPLKAQDRVIRLEERLRLERLLPDAMRPHIDEFGETQLVALRFASDDELPKLAEDALSHRMTNKQIKQAIRCWRPDCFRI